MTCRKMGDLPSVDAIIIDPDTVRIGGSEFKRARTCRKVPGRMKYGTRMPACSECGCGLGDGRWAYCPKCGAEVVEA